MQQSALFQSYGSKIFSNNLKITFKHRNCFRTQKGNVEYVDFIVIYERFKFFRNIKTLVKSFWLRPYKATGMITVDYANKFLFEPLGIPAHKNFYAKSAQAHKEFSISKLPKENVWFADSQELGTPGYGLCMTARDMAKIGQLCLNKGEFGGRQIVSSAWIREMTAPRFIEGNHFRGMEYGYLCWIISRKKNIYAAIGNSGNVIYINPQKHLVIAVASYFKPTVFDRVDFIQNHIEPFVSRELMNKKG